METKTERGFVRHYLPWLLAAGLLILYLVTLNRSLSLMGLMGVARIAGWDWHPVYHAPLLHLVTWPIRLLPHAWQIPAASAFSMVCALLSLALLARSVALLPQDRTREQRLRETDPHGLLSIKAAWLPPVLAVLVCGLQLSFWELATVGTGETLDLLLFAYCIRCLLEYRVDGRESWLSRMAFVYGLGVTNNWAMIGFFPAFLVAVIWIMGLSFFRYRFLVRTTLWGLAGLLLYLVLPLYHSWTDPVYGDFLQTLRYNLGFQKQMLQMFRPYVVLLLGLTSLLPLFVISIRWPWSMGDISAAGYTLTNLLMYVMHAVFFGITLYTAFDPAFSPRRLAGGTGVPFLTFYYVGALCIGYFCGYFLLVFGRARGPQWERPTWLREMANTVVTGIVWVLALAVPAALLYRNLPRVLARNSPELAQYGQRLAESLPPEGAVVLSDDPVRLYAVRSALGPRADQYMLLDTGALTQRKYHRHLKQRYGERLPEAQTGAAAGDHFPPSVLIDFLLRTSAQQPVCYLHPSFGYYFEHFYHLPCGLVYELKRYPTNVIEVPPLPAEVIAAQQALWQKLESEELGPLKAKIARLGPERKDVEANAQWVASYYARACDFWAVALVENNRLDAAERFLKLALELNPNNPSAFVNLEWLTHWRKTGALLERFSDEAMAKLAPFAGNWDLLLSINGPIDEPTFRLELGQLLSRNGLNRQAAQSVMRVLAVNPRDIQAAIILGNVYVQGGMVDRAFELVNRLRSDPNLAPKEAATQLDLVLIEAWGHYVKGDFARAQALLTDAQAKYSQLEGAFFSLAQMFLGQAELHRSQGRQTEYLQHMTNGLAVFEKQVKVQPNNLAALINLGGVSAQLEDYPRAIAYLTRALEVDANSQPARLNRAIAALRAGRYDDAKKDYEYLARLNPASHRAYFGLAEIAYRKQDWQSAIENYDLYLRHAPPNTSEYFFVQKRLADLRSQVK